GGAEHGDGEEGGRAADAHRSMLRPAPRNRRHYIEDMVLRSLDAAALRDVMVLFGEALEEHREELDSLNVFPVPDGDTGTNLALTQQAVVEELERLAGAGLEE